MNADISQSRSYSFPRSFFWGSATASYQVEGGISNNDWAHEALNGKLPKCDKATNHYELFEADFDIAQSLHHNAHRFSIEWSRIEPSPGNFDEREIEHYKKVLAALKKRGLEPFVTLWHFTVPIWFKEQGGFLNTDSPQIFARYCQYVVQHLGSDVKFWITINEPLIWASGGYLKGKWPPFKKNSFAFLKVVQNLIRAHIKAYSAIKKVSPSASVGIAKHNIYFSSNWNPFNKMREIVARWFWNKYFLNRISRYQDFIGLNYYLYKKFGGNEVLPKSDMGWDIFPQGLLFCLRELKGYKKPVYITENGVADAEDVLRADFIRESLKYVSLSLQENIPVKGYFYWSLLDNFEWSFGFSKRFGLVSVDCSNFNRVVRPSAFVYQEIIKNSEVY